MSSHNNSPVQNQSTSVVRIDLVFVALGLAIFTLFITRYMMSFRLDDVLLAEWANAHSPLDAFDPDRGQIVNSVRPLFALTSWVLTRTAGLTHAIWWHASLVATLLLGLAYSGRTSRLESLRPSSLWISVSIYWLCFTSILNVFFWFSDLTYGLELCFTALTWFYGLRGLRSGSLRSWSIAMLCAVLAVCSKEPAVVLIHVVLAGSLVLEWRSIRSQWRGRDRTLAAVLYGLFCLATLYILLVSPTRGNRFFHFTDPALTHFVLDRISYYSIVYCSPACRLLLFFPILYASLRRESTVTRQAAWSAVSKIVIALVLALAGCFSLYTTLPILTLAFIIGARSGMQSGAVVRRLLPFFLTILIASVTLLVTIQLVKTQLTEIAFVSVIIAGALWPFLLDDIGELARPVLLNRTVRIGGYALLGVAGILLLMGMSRKLAHQEALLRGVRDVRANANGAIQWAAKNLPKDSYLLVMNYGIHGIGRGDELTAKDDETKLLQQYTFVGGYNYIYLEQLGRRDILHGYLEDSVLAVRVLAEARHTQNAYLFLQTKLDLDAYYGRNRTGLKSAGDSLVARFQSGPYPTEIWLLR